MEEVVKDVCVILLGEGYARNEHIFEFAQLFGFAA